MIEKVRGAKKLRKKHREEETRGRSQKGEKRERNKSLRSDGVQKKEKKNKREEKMTGTDAKKKPFTKLTPLYHYFTVKCLMFVKALRAHFKNINNFQICSKTFHNFKVKC